jgi:hypothetical protein
LHSSKAAWRLPGELFFPDSRPQLRPERHALRMLRPDESMLTARINS